MQGRELTENQILMACISAHGIGKARRSRWNSVLTAWVFCLAP